MSSEAWVRGQPGTQTYVLPRSVAPLKDDIRIAGVQGTVTEAFTERATTAPISRLDSSALE